MRPCSLGCWLSSRTLRISLSSIEQNPWRRGWKFFCQEPTSQLQFWPWLKQLLEHYKEELAHRKLHLVGTPSRGFLHRPTIYAKKRDTTYLGFVAFKSSSLNNIKTVSIISLQNNLFTWLFDYFLHCSKNNVELIWVECREHECLRKLFFQGYNLFFAFWVWRCFEFFFFVPVTVSFCTYRGTWPTASFLLDFFDW